MAGKQFLRVALPLSLVAVAAIAVAAYMGAFDSPPPPEKVVIAMAKNMMGLPMLVAERQQFFAAEGLEVSLQPHPFGLPAFEAMLRREADVATVAETPLVLSSLRGQQFSVVATYMASVGHRIVARADRGIRQVDDLRGRRVGVSVGATPHYMLHVMLGESGIPDTGVEMVPMAGPKLAEALEAGRIDAAASLPPYSNACQRALGDNAVVLAPGGRYTGASNLVAARDFARRRPQAALRLLRATDRAIDWIGKNREAAIQLAIAEIGVDRPAAEEIWDELRPGLALDRGLVNLLEAEARWAIASGLAPPGSSVPDYLDFIDATALKALRPEAVSLAGGS